MLRSLNRHQDIMARANKKLKLSLVPFEEFIMNNGDLSTKSGYDNCSNINSLLQNALNQIDLNTDLLDEVISTEFVLQPTKKARSAGPHKLISKKNSNKKKSRLKTRNVGVCVTNVWDNCGSQ